MFVCEVNEEFEWVDGDEFHASERHTPSTDLLVTYLPYRLRWRTHNHHQTAMIFVWSLATHEREGTLSTAPVKRSRRSTPGNWTDQVSQQPSRSERVPSEVNT